MGLRAGMDRPLYPDRCFLWKSILDGKEEKNSAHDCFAFFPQSPIQHTIYPSTVWIEK